MRTPLRRVAPLVALAVAGLAVALVAAPASDTALGDCTPSSTWPAARADLADGVFTLVNAHRATVNAPALVVSPSLTAAAVWKARHMAMYQYLSHDDPAPPVARTTADRLAACGYSGAGWGENIAFGYSTPAAVMNGWLNSPGHRANIEEPAYRATGIGAAIAPNGAVYWAQTFGTSTAGTPPPTTTTTTTTPTPPPPPPTTTTTRATTTTPHPPATTTTTTTTPTPPRHAAPPVTISLGRSPDRGSPKADRRFVVRFPVQASVKTARRGVTCSAHMGRRDVRVLASGFSGPYAQCILVSPRDSTGRRIWGMVEVRESGAAARRWFSRLVD